MKAATIAMLALAFGVAASIGSPAAAASPVAAGAAGIREAAPRGFVQPVADTDRAPGRKPAARRRVTVQREYVEPPVPAYRPWMRPYFTRTEAIGIGVVRTFNESYLPPGFAEAHGLCWFWADPPHTVGFWDYCPAQ